MEEPTEVQREESHHSIVLDKAANVAFLSKGPLADFHDEVLFNTLEYVALFKANRPMQTDQDSVLPAKKAQIEYEALMRDVRQARLDMSHNFTSCLKEVQESYQIKRSERTEAMASHHLDSVNRCRRAQRTNLSNALAILVREADVRESYLNWIC
jgi:hypothetical protein